MLPYFFFFDFGGDPQPPIPPVAPGAGIGGGGGGGKEGREFSERLDREIRALLAATDEASAAILFAGESLASLRARGLLNDPARQGIQGTALRRNDDDEVFLLIYG